MAAIENNELQGIYEQKWNNYVEKFLSEASNELSALKEGGLLEDDKRNILEHLLKARIYADVLCDLVGITGDEKANIVSAATVHDAFVINEKAYIRSKKDEANYANLEFIKAESAKKLIALGFAQEVVELTDKNITREDGGPKDLPSQIIFLVDASLSGPEIVDVPKRVELTRLGWRSDRKIYDEATAKGTLKYWNEFFKGAPGHGERPHDEVQLESAENICKDITKLLRVKQKDTRDPKYQHIFGESGNPNMLPYYLAEKIKERILS